MRMCQIRGIHSLILIATLSLAACSSSPLPRDPYNDADSQRSRAEQAQDELSTESSKQE